MAESVSSSDDDSDDLSDRVKEGYENAKAKVVGAAGVVADKAKEAYHKMEDKVD